MKQLLNLRQLTMRPRLWRVANKGRWLPGQDPNDPAQRPAGKAPIYLRIQVGAQRVEIDTDLEATEAEWDSGAQASQANRALSKPLSALLTAAYDAETAINMQGRIVTAAGVKREMARMRVSNQPTLSKLLECYQKHRLALRANAASTVRSLSFAVGAIMKYLQRIRQVGAVLSDITPAWARQLERSLNTTFAPASTVKIIKHLKAALSYAVHEGMIDESPLEDFKLETAAAQTEKIQLTLTQLQQVESYAPSSPTLTRVQAAFLLLCYTGMSYADYQLFKPSEHLHTDDKGNRWIRMSRRKTGKAFSVLVDAKTDRMIKQHGDKLPKYASLTHFNTALRKIGTEAGLEEDLTTRVARRTFSQLMLNKGLSGSSVEFMSGHSSDIRKRAYSDTSEESVAADLKRAEFAHWIDILMKDPQKAQALRNLLES